MNLLPLAWLSLKNRGLAALLCVLTIAFSTALLLAVLYVRTQARSSFQKTISGTDLIVGARTGALPLMLYTVFGIGEVTNNIPWQSYQRIAQDARVAWSIPLVLGDSHQGYRVVGTTQNLFKHYRYGDQSALQFSSGLAFNDGQRQAVIGAEVASKLRYTLGLPLIVAHGMGKVSFVKHANAPLSIVGILAPTGTPVDQSIYVPLAAIEHMHENQRDKSAAHEHENEHEHSALSPAMSQLAVSQNPSAPPVARSALSPPSSITAFLLGLKIRQTALSLQREINTSTEFPMQAVLPVATLQQLWRMVSVVESALLFVAAAVVLTGLLGMLMSLWATLDLRRREMAILRAVGAKARHVLALLMLETLILVSAGLLTASLLVTVGLVWAGPWMTERYGLHLQVQWWTPDMLRWLGWIFGLALLLGLLPAIAAYRNSLVDGLQIRS